MKFASIFFKAPTRYIKASVATKEVLASPRSAACSFQVSSRLAVKIRKNEREILSLLEYFASRFFHLKFLTNSLMRTIFLSKGKKRRDSQRSLLKITRSTPPR